MIGLIYIDHNICIERVSASAGLNLLIIVCTLNYLYDLRYINIPQLAKSFWLQFAFSMISCILDATASSQLLFIVYDGRKGTIICHDAAVKAMIHHYCTKTVITTSSVGATTFSITTLGITTLSINSLSIKTLYMMPLI